LMDIEQTRTGSVSAYAPGRVELLGNHTDYNEGVVLAAALDRGIKVSGDAHDDELVQVHSTRFGAAELKSSALHPQTENRWANYAFGVTQELIDLGVPIKGFSAEVEGDLPIGTGLSSSAAFEVSTALFLLKLFRRQLPRLEIAKACQRAEHRFVGVQSGLLDQVTSLFGRADHAVFFDCRTETIRTIPFPTGLAFVIADSGKNRELASGQYNLRREETRAAARALGVRALRDLTLPQLAAHVGLPEQICRRAKHVVEENQRVWRAVEFLKDGDGAEFGQLMNASHESSRHNFENSTRELDLLVSIAQRLPGTLGARLTGAGFDGAILILCERSRAQVIAAEVSQRYFSATGIKAPAFVCRIADGAA
jgi:galactokinase